MALHQKHYVKIINRIWSSVYLMYIIHETFPKIVYGTLFFINSLIFKDKLQEMSSSNIWQNIRTKIKYTFWNLIVSTQKSQLIYCKSDISTLISNHWNHWIDKPFKEYWIFGLARIQLMFYFGLCLFIIHSWTSNIKYVSPPS